jgi:hypothetical protein
MMGWHGLDLSSSEQGKVVGFVKNEMNIWV